MSEDLMDNSDDNSQKSHPITPSNLKLINKKKS